MSEAAGRPTYEDRLAKLRQELDVKKIKWTARMTIRKLNEKLEDWYDDDDDDIGDLSSAELHEKDKQAEREMAAAVAEQLAKKRKSKAGMARTKASLTADKSKPQANTLDPDFGSSSATTVASRSRQARCAAQG